MIALPTLLAAIGIVLLGVVAAVMAHRSSRDSGDGQTPDLEASQQPLDVEPLHREPAGAVAEGDLRLQGDTRFPGGVTLQGDLFVEEHAHVDGPVRVNGTAHLAPSSTVKGHLNVQGDVRLSPNATVQAASMNGDAYLDDGSTIQDSLDCARLHVAAGRPQEARDAVES